MANFFGFRAVGQGLFYTGSILDGEYKFVYDCGTDNSQCYVEREVRRFSARCRKKELDFVVLSHLHHDHYSGLQELMHNFNVKCIYLPYLGNNRNLIDLVLAYSTFVESRNDEADIEENYSVFRFMQQLYNGESVIMGAEKIFLGREGSDSEDDSEYIHTHRMFDFNRDGRPYWEFQLLNKTYNRAKMKMFEDAVDKLIANSGKTIRELIDSNQIELIKQVYEEVFGKGNNLNLSSTVLVHYPVDTNKRFRIAGRSYDCICARECFNANMAITMLTGDAQVDRWEVSYLNSLSLNCGGILQVPHHGSYNNWCSLGSVRDNFNAMVISSGLCGNHGLPSARTVDDIILNRGARLYLVNQNQGFYYSIITNRCI